MVSDQPVFTPTDLGLLFTLPGEAWYRAMVNVAGTLNLDWAVETLFPELVGQPDSYAQLEAMIAPLPIGSEGIGLSAVSERERHYRAGRAEAGARQLSRAHAASQTGPYDPRGL